MRLYLIRHSLTEGNIKRRYIGKTDEPLCRKGIRLLEEGKADGRYPQADRIYISPMMRCRQTAELLYPGQELVAIEELEECNFGLFENKNYKELSNCPQYQEWVDSKGTLPFPGGESREEFKARCLHGFEKSLGECMKDGVGSAAYVVHGGTIMCIMEEYVFPQKDYYDYQVGNSEGYMLETTDGAGSHGDGNGALCVLEIVGKIELIK